MLMFVVMPLVMIAIYSFTDASGSFTLANFKRFFTTPEDLHTFAYSIEVALITTVLCLLLGYPAAWILSNAKLNRSKVTVMLFILPMWINMLIRTLATVALFDFLRLPLGEGALIFGMVYNFLPFMILEIHTSLSKMDPSFLEAASDLGANRVQAFRRVTLPLSIPGIISGITLVFLPAVSSFFIPKLLGGGQYVLIGNVIESQFLTSGNWSFGSALSLIMVIIIMISMYLTRKIDRNVGDEI